MPNLYQIHSLDEIPLGVEYRILANRLDQPEQPSYIETRELIDGLEKAPETYENGAPIWIEDLPKDWINCTDEEVKRTAKQAALDAYAEQLDAAMAVVEDMRQTDLATIQATAITELIKKIQPIPIDEPIERIR